MLHSAQNAATQRPRRLIAVLVTTRETVQLTQRDLAHLLKRPHSFVSRVEAGERRVDVIEFIEIARVLDVEPKQLFAKVLD
jgi:transcriptional regulator with XRE-family HTH domain